jgi:excisionase family DNA binding protein
MRVGKANGREWLRLAEAATILGVSHNTLRRWSDEGRLTSYRSPGGHRRYRRADVQASLRRSGPAPEMSGLDHDADTAGSWQEPALRALAAVAARGCGVTSCCIAVEDGADGLRVVSAFGDGEPCDVGARLALSSHPAEAEVLRSGRRLPIPDVARTRLLARAAAAEYCRAGFLGLLVLPIEAPGQQGVLRLGDSRGPHAFDMAAMAFAEFMAHHAGVLLAGGCAAGQVVPPREPPLAVPAGTAAGSTPPRAPDLAPLGVSPRDDEELVVLRRARDLALLSDALLQDPARRGLEAVMRGVVERLAAATRTPIVEVYVVEGDTVRALVSYDGGRWDDAWEQVVLRLERYPTTLRAVESGETFMVTALDDPSLDADGRFSLEKWGYQSHLAVPLSSNGRVIGLLELFDYVPHDFSPDLELVGLLGQVAARALADEQLRAQVRRRSRIVDELVAITEDCARATDARELVDRVAERLQSALGAGSCQVYLATPQGFLCVASHDRSGPDREAVGTLADMSAYPTAAAAMDALDVLVIRSVDDAHMGEAEQAVYRASGYVSEACVPLVRHGRLTGFLDVCDTRPRGYTEYTGLLRAVAGALALALEGGSPLDEFAREATESAPAAGPGGRPRTGATP